MKGQPTAHASGGDEHGTATILGDLRQRRLLAVLLDQSGPTPVPELGARLAAREAGVHPRDVAQSDHESAQIALEHRCLPKLEAFGWIDRRSEGIVASDPLPIETRDLSLPDLRDPTDPHWGPICQLLGRPRRQGVAAVLADASGRIGLRELTDELRTRTDHLEAVPHQAKQELKLTLHHTDLPKLADVDLLRYDSAANTVARTRRLESVVERTGLASGQSDPRASGQQ